MPTYQYRCAKCGEEFELWQSIHDDALTGHPGCGGVVTKVFAPAGIVLKGSGFYRTDSRSAPGKGSRESKEKEPAKEGASASGNGAGGEGKGSSDGQKPSGSSGDGAKGSKASKDAKPSTSGSSST
jgi:putative FmdB family regulatory protein